MEIFDINKARKEIEFMERLKILCRRSDPDQLDFIHAVVQSVLILCEALDSFFEAVEKKEEAGRGAARSATCRGKRRPKDEN